MRGRDRSFCLPALRWQSAGSIPAKEAKSLGLRIVHILTQRLDGTLTLNGGGGACFTVTFPLDGERAIEPAGD